MASNNLQGLSNYELQQKVANLLSLLQEKNRIIDKLHAAAASNDCKAKLLTLRARVSNVVAVHDVYDELEHNPEQRIPKFFADYLRRALTDTALEHDTSEVPE